MEKINPDPAPVYYPPAAKPGVFGTRIPAAVTFTIAVLLFLMPFLDIRCNNMSLQTVNGLELATGFQVKSPGKQNGLFDGLDKLKDADEKEKPATEKAEKPERKDPNPFAMASLVLGAAGMILSFFNYRSGMAGAIATGVLAAGALIGLMVDLKRDIGNGSLLKDKPLTVSIEFTHWFYITIVAFLAAAVFSWMRMRLTKKQAGTV